MGRIGRATLKVILNSPKLELVAVKAIISIENKASLIKYDSVYGIYEKEVSHDENDLIRDGITVEFYSQS